MTTFIRQKDRGRTGHIMRTFNDIVSSLQEFLRIDTSNPPGNEEDAILFLEDILKREGIESEIYLSAPRRANILARIKGSLNEGPVVLLAHVDVVPAKEEEWTVDPFGGEIRDGYLYGRGTIDMKAQAICQLFAFIDLAKQGLTPKRDIIFLATSDEEVGGSFGVAYMLDKVPELKKASFVLSEGGSLIEENGSIHAQVSVTEKKLAQFIVKATGTGGHGSMPHRDNANEKVIRAAQKIVSYKWPMKATAIASAHLEGMLAGHSIDGEKFHSLKEALRSRKWKEYLEKNEMWNAVLRNTATLTIMRGGDKVNVIPAESEAHFDARLLPTESHDNFFAKIRRLAGDEVEVERIGADIAEPGPSRYNNVYFKGISDCIRSFKGKGTPVLPSITTGATDLRYFRNLGVTSFGFFPITLTKEEHMKMHRKDERISIENIREGLEGCREIVNFLAFMEKT